MSPTDSGRATVVDCSGVGPGGITRVLTELVRHWPAGRPLRIVAAPPTWEMPTEAADVAVLSRQNGARAHTITSATAMLRRATGAAQPGTRVLSLSPSAAIVGSRLPVTTVLHDLAFRLWPHGLSPAVRQYRRISYATAVRRSRRLLCVSARTRHDLLGLYGVADERTEVWHPGSDLAVVPGPLPGPLARLREQGRAYLLIAGHAAHKGVEIAVDALPELPGHTLAVLTGGQRVDRFAHHAAGSGAADRVLFLDRLTDAGYAAALGSAAAFLMPSHFEGYGLPAAEAVRLGTPTVVSPDPALHEATDGRAVRMTSWTPQALAAAVRLAVTSPRPPEGHGGRSWRAATAHLVTLLDAVPVERCPAPTGR
ncbi:glycosyltransferase [Micromonospora sp. KC606]|uniref:glycosyltransferase n=1 Tax=Micromonospora sp. KC606 TaxID=2530379 RepID=UPI001043EB1D|nr:glycosyltransferase [Micromonospora sp. KC606]TDC76035.1 glycosyltransferase [Micromonospora sp. KC606]